MPGDERELDDEAADYLTKNFPGAFHSAMLDAAPKGQLDPGLPEVLEQSIPKFRAALATGDYDGVLDVLRAAENGRTDKSPRSGIVSAVDDRKDEVSP